MLPASINAGGRSGDLSSNQPTAKNMSSLQSTVCKILVAHEEPIAAAGLLASLSAEPGFETTKASALGSECHGLFDIVIADHQTAMEMLAQERSEFLPRNLVSARVIVMSARPQAADIRQAIHGGASGYLQLGCSLKELTLSVKSVSIGSRYLCSAVARKMADSLLNVALTSREDDVMRHLVRGHCNKAIAKELHIATGTVKTHMRAIMAKLNAKSRNEAASIARSQGLVGETASSRTFSEADRCPPAFRTGTTHYANL